jgi:hypothetical protein
MKKNKVVLDTRTKIVANKLGEIMAILLGIAVILGLVWFIVWIIKSIAGM